MDNKELIRFTQEFIDAFENVFDKDWSYTKEMLGIYSETEEQEKAAQDFGLDKIELISEEGSFLKPLLNDELEDWGARGLLLQKYRNLKKLIEDTER